MAKELEQATFKLKFEGEVGEIDASVFASSLTNIITILEESNQQIAPQRRLNIKVRSLEAGSFIVGMTVESQPLIQTVLELVKPETVAGVVSLLVGIFKVRKALKGEKPTVIENDANNYQLTTKNGNNVIIDKRTYNIYKDNRQIARATNNMFGDLSGDPNVAGLEILDERDRSLFEAGRTEFLGMSLDVSEEEQKIKIKAIKATVNIFKLVWDERYKWEFLYEGRKISAPITDEGFFKLIHAGEQFAEGDSLEVNLEIEQIFDEKANGFVDRAFTVTKVLKHIPRAAQAKLPL